MDYYENLLCIIIEAKDGKVTKNGRKVLASNLKSYYYVIPTCWDSGQNQALKCKTLGGVYSYKGKQTVKRSIMLTTLPTFASK